MENELPNQLKGNGIREKAINSLLYFWNVYIWPNVQMDAERKKHFENMGRFMGIKDGERVLEIGSNKPLYRIYSHDVGAKGLFVATDVYAKVQERARAQLIKEATNKEGTFSEKLITGDALRLSFADNSFDKVVASNFFPYMNPAAKEAMRVLKPGGALILARASGKNEMPDKDIKRCRKIGFKIDPPHFFPDTYDKSHGNWVFKATKPPPQ